MIESAPYRDLARLTTILKVCLGVYTVISLIALWSDWLSIDFLQSALASGDVSETGRDAIDTRRGIIALAQIGILIVTNVFFLRWTYLANVNARALGANLNFTPGWSVGWYFIPIATAWKPYQALKNIFMGSNPDHIDDWYNAPPPAILPVWWTLWLLATFSSPIVVKYTLRDDSVEDMLTSSWMLFVSDALDISLCIVAFVVVSTMYKWQSEKQRRLAVATIGTVPTPSVN